jgi:SAM-dependent methyltransferase
MSPLSTFPWPVPPGATNAPVWKGDGFELEGSHRPVVCYTDGASNWSSQLTEFHEQLAGPFHPIDIASRRLALDTLRRFCGNDPGALVLEAGCSSGYLLEQIQREQPRLQVVGSDYLAAPLLGLARRLPAVPLLQFDLRDCPLPSQSFDAAVLLNVLEHIDDDQKALSEVARVLKPGGIAHIEVPSGPDCYDIYDEHLLHHRRYRLAGLVEQALREGFNVVKATHLGCFVFPAFYIVKQRNKKLLSLPREEKEKIVAQQIRQTGTSPLMGLVMKAEVAMGRIFSYPFGIRCVVVLRKPA